ncbi:hypothetical protein pipiens_004726 [Culex pipiens pipiens]|uniref:Uncharacterized protein n=1 Tax=Culex pipiens pipiens TaxID=38569 RepID=A0ABD1CFN4_CULPP
MNLNPSNMPSFDRCCRAWVCCGEKSETLKMIGCDRGDDQTSQMILLLGVDGQEQLIEASLLNAGRANYALCTSREMYHEGEKKNGKTTHSAPLPLACSLSFSTA